MSSVSLNSSITNAGLRASQSTSRTYSWSRSRMSIAMPPTQRFETTLSQEPHTLQLNLGEHHPGDAVGRGPCLTRLQLLPDGRLAHLAGWLHLDQLTRPVGAGDQEVWPVAPDLARPLIADVGYLDPLVQVGCDGRVGVEAPHQRQLPTR